MEQRAGNKSIHSSVEAHRKEGPATPDSGDCFVWEYTGSACESVSHSAAGAAARSRGQIPAPARWCAPTRDRACWTMYICRVLYFGDALSPSARVKPAAVRLPRKNPKRSIAVERVRHAAGPRARIRPDSNISGPMCTFPIPTTEQSRRAGTAARMSLSRVERVQRLVLLERHVCNC
jgi:hypothetical protein